MALGIHRSERADTLVGGLAEVLAVPPADPFAPDVVAVPSQGVERWISQSLSAVLGVGRAGEDGVCANVVFPSPGRLVREALGAAWDVPADEDPWAEHRLAWPLLDVIDACVGEDWCRLLGRHLGVVDGGSGHGRRMAVAQRLAGLFSSYGAQRPNMLRDWRAGRDTDGAEGQVLDGDHRWQAELWRRLRAEVGVESPAERLDAACARLREDPTLVGLPDRLSVFGPTRLTTDQLQVLDALAEHREVHLWLPHPSPGLWRRGADHGSPVVARCDDPGTDLPLHPLLRSCARDAREMQARLTAAWSGPVADEHLSGATPPATLLGVLQRDLHEDRLPDLLREASEPRTGGPSDPPGPVHVLAEGDTSVQVHACHGRQRQVEVLREVLLGLLEDDPTLELREIIVMCPDIESYAPLISAAFGLSADAPADHPADLPSGLPGFAADVSVGSIDGADGSRTPRSGTPRSGTHGSGTHGSGATGGLHPGHLLTVRLADRSLRQTNPVLEVAGRLLHLADARVTVSEVLDLVQLPPVRRRFRLDADDLERVDDWVRGAGVRWGLDAAGRERFGLGGLAANTWQAGLDRALVGVAMDEDDCRTLGSVLPLDDVDSNEVDLAGRLAELLDRLGAAVDALSREQPLTAWVDALAGAVESMADVAPGDAWQMSQARRQLSDVLVAADRRATGATLRLSDVRALFAERLRGRPTRANFRTGHLTMCTMVPMRSVPHRVVCLLGVDDGVFPRGARIDGDDVLARRPLVGERDPRSEDRQLFLDAVLAARERLVVLYAGADERTGARRPPAVPIGELLDVLDVTARRGPGSAAGSVRDAVLVRHPLQPFDVRNFEPARLQPAASRAFSFDRASYDGSRALVAPRTPRPSFLPAALPEQEPLDLLPIDSLVRLLEHPVKHFMRQRLGLGAGDDDEPADDGIPVTVGPLDTWAVGDRLLRAGLAGVTRDRAVLAERLRGELPPGPLGHAVVEPVAGQVRELVAESLRLRAGEPSQVDVSVDLPGGVTVAGTVPVTGNRVVRVVYSRLAAKHRVRAWVQLLALCAGGDDRDWEAVTVGRARPGLAVSRLAGPSPRDAAGLLGDLVEVYRQGMAAPLPIPPRTAAAYADKRSRGVPAGTALTFAGKEWRSVHQQTVMGDGTDAEHRQVWGDVELVDLPAVVPQDRAQNGAQDPDPTQDPTQHPAQDPTPDWADEPHEFGRLARRVWSPLLAAETRAAS